MDEREAELVVFRQRVEFSERRSASPDLEVGVPTSAAAVLADNQSRTPP
jgi:hypothetical protein